MTMIIGRLMQLIGLVWVAPGVVMMAQAMNDPGVTDVQMGMRIIAAVGVFGFPGLVICGLGGLCAKRNSRPRNLAHREDDSCP